MRTLAAAIVINALAFLIAFSFAQPAPDATRPCISLDLTLYTYDGPIVVDGACVDDISYTTAALRVVAHDSGDGIFHNGLEATP